MQRGRARIISLSVCLSLSLSHTHIHTHDCVLSLPPSEVHSLLVNNSSYSSEGWHRLQLRGGDMLLFVARE